MLLHAAIFALLGAISLASGAEKGAGRSAYSAICVVAKNENRYIREWADYHLCLGIGAIHVYDHESNRSLAGELSDLVAEGSVTVERFEGNHKRFEKGFSSHLDRFRKTAQGYAYEACLQKHSSEHTFIGFLDTDEFLVINDREADSVDSILREYESFGGVSFHWRVMGSSGHEARPAGPVVDSYTSCLPKKAEVNRQFKSFVNTRFHPVMHSPHRASFKHEEDEVPPEVSEDGSGRLTGGAFLVDEMFNPLKPGLKNKAMWKRVAVYHYVTKSREDFREKMERGGGAGVTRNMTHFDKVNQQAEDTCLGALTTRRRFCAATPSPRPAG